MRLVSAIYNDFYPFEALDLFDDFIATTNPDDLNPGDVLVVWGGDDISPVLYKHGRSSRSHAWHQGMSKRDAIEWALMQKARSMNIPIIGICRGAQMLCALAGGHLVQDVNNHFGSHKMDTPDGTKLRANSIHHQMMVPHGTAHEMLAWTKPLSEQYVVCPHDKDVVYAKMSNEVDPEFVYFNDVKGFAVQWHPEMMDVKEKATQYVFDTIERKIGQ
jgi:putative glutamine amidotransferase